jgi:hypothetical protein
MTWVCRHCDGWFRDWGDLQEHLADIDARCAIDQLAPAIERDDDATSDPDWVAAARRRRDDLRGCFAGLDVPGAQELQRAYARIDPSDMLGPDLPDLTAAEWMAVLEAAGNDLYARCYERDYGMDYEITWLVRYDSARSEWVYATVQMGETYRGPEGENAYRQVQSVLRNDAPVTPMPMTDYPIDANLEVSDVIGQ